MRPELFLRVTGVPGGVRDVSNRAGSGLDRGARNFFFLVRPTDIERGPSITEPTPAFWDGNEKCEKHATTFSAAPKTPSAFCSNGTLRLLTTTVKLLARGQAGMDKTAPELS